ncbi:MAG: hypothetical protein H6Q66_2620 [Firmicutes bacterium]|nr:hypothetical protein [Bacillota bacterium]
MLRIANFRVSIDDSTPLVQLVSRKLKIPQQEICGVSINRKALDARRKKNICFVYSLDVRTTSFEKRILAKLGENRDVTLVDETIPEEELFCGKTLLDHPPVVIGFGPAGMLAALKLAEYGFRPLVLERGRNIDRRTQDVANFWRTGNFDAVSNVQFGEGGAGTFSDGKLTTRVHDPRMREVLELFVAAGAPAEICYHHKPHIGTDKLRSVVKNIRNKIIQLGGQVEFESQITDLTIRNGKLLGITINGSQEVPCNVVLAGIGHSARDTYQMLYSRGVAMEAKPFAIGVRIEHPQHIIDLAQYGSSAGHPALGPADYALVYHSAGSGRTAYSFCMCPGGSVVAAASEDGGVVTNGMSLYNRNSGIANSALVVNVNAEDFGPGVLSGIEFQRHYEQLAYRLGGGNYSAPVQTVKNFLAGTVNHSKFLAKPSYRPGVTAADLRGCLPNFVSATLAEALPAFNGKIKDFAHGDAVMTGVETRTSAPVRILRATGGQSVNVSGLYPIGEGAGYAGGIMSAALDGLNAAISIIKEYQS